MNESTPIEKNNPQEIDLWEILKKVYIGLKDLGKWLYEALLFLVGFAIRKFVWLLCCAVIGGGLAFFLYKSSPYYNSVLQLRSNVLSNSFFVNLVNETMSESNRDYKVLAQKLNMPDSLAKKIQSIKAYYGVDVNKDTIVDFLDKNNTYIRSTDTLKAAMIVPRLFFIDAVVSTDTVLPYIKRSILNMFENNEYVTQHNKRRLIQIKGRMNELAVQLSRLDSLQKVDYFNQEHRYNTKAGNTSLMLSLEQKLYHYDIMWLLQQRMSLESALALDSLSITLVKDFSETPNFKQSLWSYIADAVGYALLIGFPLLLLWEYRKKIIQEIKRGQAKRLS